MAEAGVWLVLRRVTSVKLIHKFQASCDGQVRWPHANPEQVAVGVGQQTVCPRESRNLCDRGSGDCGSA